MTSEKEIELSDSQLRVSSVLSKDNKNYGKKNLIDGSEETCWNSDAGSPQWVQWTPTASVELHTVAIKFQGGFAAKRFVVERRQAEGSFTALAEFYPDDHGKLQVFRLPTAQTIEPNPLRLTFYDSYDTFGRIIIYVLKMYENK